MRNALKKFTMIGAATVALAMAGAASAAPVITKGNTGGLSDSNVIFNACSGNTTSGTTIQGCLNDAHDIFVNFTSNETLEIQGGGQARIDSDDGRFDLLTIALADETLGFGSLILNVRAAQGDTGDLFFDIALASGATFTSDFYGIGNGQNFFTLLAPEGDLFTSVTVQSAAGDNSVQFADVRQVRIGGVAEIDQGGGGLPVPEPGAIGLLGLGLVAVGFGRRRKAA